MAALEHEKRRKILKNNLASLSWRPAHLAPAENVTMQMRNRFASVRAVIDHKTITAFLQAGFLRDFSCLQQNMSEHFVVARLRLGNSRDHLFRNNQNMHGRAGFDVAQRENQIVFVNNLRRDLSRDYFLKQSHWIYDV